MAVLLKSINEVFGSRDGDARGRHGVISVRVFRVELDIPAEDRTELRKPDPRGYVEARYPYGSRHPWNSYTFANGYRLIRSLTHQTSLVGVDYGIGGPLAATIQPDHRRWSLGVRSAGISQRILEEPTAALESWREAFDLPATRKPRRLGTTKYVFGQAAIEDEQGWARMWQKEEGTGKIEPVDEPVAPAGGGLYVPFEFTSDLPGLALAMTRMFATFPTDGLGALAAYRGTLNNTPFKGADLAHVKLVDFAIDEVATVLDDGTAQRSNPGIAYRFMLAFLWSSVPFIGPGSPLSLVPTISDEDNDKVPVMRIVNNEDVKITEELYPIRGMDFDALVAYIESFTAPIRPPRGER